MEPPIKAEMTPEENSEMLKLCEMMTNKLIFEHGYRMGFIAGKLSAINHIVNHSPLYNGELKQQLTSEQDSPASDSEERVAAPGKKGNTGAVHGKRKDKGSTG